MEKERFITRAHRTTRYYLSPKGAKMAHVQPKGNDTSDWWYVWDNQGKYKGCANNMATVNLKDIDKKEFMKN